MRLVDVTGNQGIFFILQGLFHFGFLICFKTVNKSVYKQRVIVITCKKNRTKN